MRHQEPEGAVTAEAGRERWRLAYRCGDARSTTGKEARWPGSAAILVGLEYGVGRAPPVISVRLQSPLGRLFWIVWG